jgi:hypothetical protein
MNVRGFVRLLMSVLLLCAVSACGVGSQQHAVEIPSDDLPSVLEEPSGSGSPSASPPSPSTGIPPLSSSTIFLVDDKTKTLVAVDRPRAQTATITALVKSLLTGPTTAESAAGLTTAINTSPTLNKITLDGSLATVDLSSSFGEIRGAGEVLATAQVVMTVVSYPGTDSVQFSLDGTPTSVPLVSGVLSSGPLTYDDYASLLFKASPSKSLTLAPAMPTATPPA